MVSSQLAGNARPTLLPENNILFLFALTCMDVQELSLWKIYKASNALQGLGSHTIQLIIRLRVLYNLMKNKVKC
jgi:hypothetical protein